MASAKKFVFEIAAEYEGDKELRQLQTDLKQLDSELKTIGKIDNFNSLQKSIAETNTKFVEAKAKARELRQAVREVGSSSNIEAFEKANAEVAKFSSTLSKQKTQLVQARQDLKNQGIAVSDLAGEYQKLQTAAASRSTAADSYGRVLAAQNTLGVRSLKEIKSEIKGLESAYKTLENSGTASMRELKIAKEQLQKKTAALHKEMGVAGTVLDANVKRYDRSATSLGRMRAAAASLVGFMGVFAGFQAISEVNTLLKDASSAAYDLEASLTAANRQFDVGGADQWEATIASLNEELRVYSDAELQKASARTIDMTKRLGLNADQMEEVIRKTADLSIGRTSLEDGIERVTSALRGEAEASEYLGLTLNETFVKSWYAARGELQGAWKDLDDVQKALIRYQVFLEQAEPLAGKAAASVDTYTGAIKLVRKEIQDGIGQNEELVTALKEVAVVLRDNADELGEFAASIASGAGAVIEFTANNKDLLINLVKWGVPLLAGVKLMGSLASTLVVTNGAMSVMTGSGFVAWLTRVGPAALASVPGVTSLSGALGALGLWAAGGIAGYNLGKNLIPLESELVNVQGATKELESNTAKLNDEYAKISQSTGVAITSMEELDAAVAAGKLHYDDLSGSWKAGAAEMAESAEVAAEAQVAATVGATKEMKAAYKKYVDEIKKLQDQIADREQSLAEQLREMARSGMDDYSAWQDRKAEAEEYARAAEQAAAAGDFSAAVKLADQAKAAYADLNEEVKVGDKVMISQQQALQTSMAGVKSAGELAINILKQQEQAAKDAATALDAESGYSLSEEFGAAGEAITKLEKETDDYKQAIIKVGDTWVGVHEDNRAAGMDALNELQREIERMDGQHIEVIADVVQAKATGGLIQRFASGGRLPGYGGGDRIHALLEAGEFIIRKEAVRKFGTNIFTALNNLRLPDIPRFATGGPVLAGAASSGSGETINFTFTFGSSTVGPFQGDRAAVRAMQRAMAKMEMGSS